MLPPQPQVSSRELFALLRIQNFFGKIICQSYSKIDTVREEVIDQLIFNYSHGAISNEAFERRLDKAMAGQSHQTLVDLVADLELKADSNFSAQKDTQFNVNYGQNRPEETDTIVNIFGGANRGGQWAVPKEIRIFSLFGGSNIDFSDAIFHTAHVTIKVLCIFGGEKFMYRRMST